MEKLAPFRDRYGNLLPNSWDHQSENPTTFNVSLFFSALYNGTIHQGFLAQTSALVFAKYRLNNNEWRTMEHDPNPDWSLDEKISALAFYSRTSQTTTKLIPVFASLRNSSFWSWLRPDVMAYTIGSKYPMFRSLMWHGIIKHKINKSLEEYKENPAAESSGVQLGFIMAMGWSKEHWIFENEDYIEGAMRVYYKDMQHPIPILWGWR